MSQTIVDVTGAAFKTGSTPADYHGGNTSKCSVTFEASVDELPTFGSFPDQIPVATKKSCKISVEYYAANKTHLEAGSTTAFALTSPALDLSGNLVVSKVQVDDDAGSGGVKCSLEGTVKPGYTLGTGS